MISLFLEVIMETLKFKVVLKDEHYLYCTRHHAGCIGNVAEENGQSFVLEITQDVWSVIQGSPATYLAGVWKQLNLAADIELIKFR